MILFGFSLWFYFRYETHTESTLSDGHNLPSVCSCQLLQPGEILRLSVLLKLTAAGGMAPDGAEELV